MNKDKILRALDDILDDLAYEADHAESSSSKEDFEEKYDLVFDAMILLGKTWEMVKKMIPKFRAHSRFKHPL